MIKTKEMIVGYRKRRTKHAPILINRAVVEQVESFKFLGIHITNKLSWSKHTKTIKNLIPSRVLRACADQLAGVFTDLFNQSLSQSAVPTCFKIVSVPKEAKVTELSDYLPIALTSVIMKCFERLVNHLHPT